MSKSTYDRHLDRIIAIGAKADVPSKTMFWIVNVAIDERTFDHLPWLWRNTFREPPRVIAIYDAPLLSPFQKLRKLLTKFFTAMLNPAPTRVDA